MTHGALYLNQQKELEPEQIELCCRILGLTALDSLLQYVNWLFWEVCSVN